MAWVKVESSVSRNRKFVKAGPAPAWLWLCGLAYCQEGLTDGFIPHEALEYLGVKNAKNLADRLVEARLWDRVSGGWQVHDYLEHNRSRARVREISGKRSEAGSQGGRPKQDEKQIATSEKANEKQVVNPATDVAVAGVAAVGEVLQRKKEFGPRDVWWLELLRRYPEKRVVDNRRVQGLFNDQFDRDERDDVEVWADILEGLESQSAGYEWRVKGMVPSLEKWLDGRWKQRHEAAPVSSLVSEKTARTLSSAAEFIKAGGGQ